MSEIIAETYERLGFIGEGGGGNVFLARHLRLDKMVVMKADKRKVTTRPELLRREVDVLKNLSHAYIPKVFDYFVENDTVYTVMDYIDGESLDKPLKRGERFPQAQIIEWAKELLEALKYLHSPTHGDPPRGYVHSDIKPANIMTTRFGTICLIDFNIALALGEENVVGASAGYASPEHYGLDYSSGFTAISKKNTNTNTVDPDKTVLLNSNPGFNSDGETVLLPSDTVADPNGKTELIKPNKNTMPTSQTSVRKVVPDVRSDIYSTGATLYHLLSGKRPAKNATEVEPLTSKEVSLPVARIINKAMNPNPDLRYQSAAEMLYELEHLRENDPRVKRRRRALAVFEGCMGAVFALGLFASFTGLKRIQATDNALKLAEYSDNALVQGNTVLALDYALQALPQNKTIFTPEPTAEAQCALAEALKVYDLSDSYKPDKTVELPSEPTAMALAPNGKTFVCVCSGKAVVIDTGSGDRIAELETDKSALSQVKYLDNDTLIYAANGALKAYSIPQRSELWSGGAATSVEISADGSTVAAVYKGNGYAVLYDAETGAEKARVDFGGRKQAVVYNDSFIDPERNLFAINNDGTLLAASFEDGTLCVWQTSDGELLLETPTTENTVFSGGFYKNMIAFSAIKDNVSAFMGYDIATQDSLQSEMDYPVYVLTNEDGVFLKTENKIVRLDTAMGSQTPLISTSEAILKFDFDSEHAVITTKDGVRFFDKNAREISRFDNPDNNSTFDFVRLNGNTAVIGSLNSNIVRVMKYENRTDANIFNYDSSVVHDEARVSADGKTVTLFRFDGFTVFDMDGNVIKTMELPDADTVYDQQFVRENGESVLEVIYYSGKVDVYSAADGSLLRTEQREVNDKEIEDVFYTDDYKIVSPLHGNPQVYDRTTDAPIKELSEDSYLTYITQQGEYIIAQYVRTDGEFYGVLMNEKCETLARLPRLCDVYEGKLYFDYSTGNLRRSGIYDLGELIDTAEQMEKEM